MTTRIAKSISRSSTLLALLSPDIADLFWGHVDRSAGLDGCWPWTMDLGRKGYGRLTIHSRQFLAHRVAWVLSTGHDLPMGQSACVCHSCDNPICCNPRHLFVGTVGDNNRDGLKKGRIRPVETMRGDRHWNARLTPAAIVDIRTRVWLYGETAPSIAASYGVNPVTIERAADGRTWRYF